jgi:hypothetical protein
METIPSAQNFADLNGRLNVAQNEITRLKAALVIAEANSAAKLGVPPIDFTSTRHSGSGVDALTVYNSMESGPAKTEYYRRHQGKIWAAKEANGGAAE